MISLNIIQKYKEQYHYEIYYNGHLMKEPEIIVSHIGRDITINYIEEAMQDWMTIELKDELFKLIREYIVSEYNYEICHRNLGGQLYTKWLRRQ
jgi:hypothetical protein